MELDDSLATLERHKERLAADVYGEAQASIVDASMAGLVNIVC